MANAAEELLGGDTKTALEFVQYNVDDETTDDRKCGVLLQLAEIIGNVGKRQTAEAFRDRWMPVMLKSFTASERGKAEAKILEYLKLGSGDKRLSFEDAKSFTWENMTPELMASLSPGHQLLAKALMGSSSEQEALKMIRRDFYRLTPDERFFVVKAAFDDDSGDTGMLRQLISELPEEQQNEILGA